MKFQLHIRTPENGEDWWETYTNNMNMGDIEEWAKRTLATYNSGLRPQEKRREYLGFRLLDVANIQHEWQKYALYTQERGGRLYDIMKCKGCGITGKRFGISGTVKIDSAYRKAVYRRCDTAVVEMKRRK